MKKDLNFKDHWSVMIYNVATVLILIIVASLTLFKYLKSEETEHDNIIMLMLSLLVAVVILLAIRQIFDKNKSSKEHSTIANELITVLDYVGPSMKEFKDYKEQSEFLSNAFKKADKVEDLTWSNHDGSMQTDELNEYVKQAGENNKEYKEVFIFEIIDNGNGSIFRKDRLQKLKFHYEQAISEENKKSNYCCSFFEKSDLPRIQFTIIDEKMIAFTSKREGRIVIENEMLVHVFSKLYEQIWYNSNKLIINGEIVTGKEPLIKSLLKNLD